MPIKHDQHRDETRAEGVVQGDVEPSAELAEHFPTTCHEPIESVETLRRIHKRKIRPEMIRVLADVQEKSCAIKHIENRNLIQNQDFGRRKI